MHFKVFFSSNIFHVNIFFYNYVLQLTFIGTDSDPIAEGNEVPKILGDVFESLVAAIFLDSDMSLDEVWRVFSPIIQPEIGKWFI